MTSVKIILMLYLACYLMVSAQLIYYVIVMGEALKKIPIQHFLQLRKLIDPLVVTRYRWVYGLCLVLSASAMLLSQYDTFSAVDIYLVISFACLVLDIALALKGNLPLNTLVNAGTLGEHWLKWEILRIKWIRLIRYRGVISGVGMVTLLVGLVANLG